MDLSKTTVAQLQVGDVARFHARRYLGRFMVLERSQGSGGYGFTHIYYEDTKEEETLTWQVGNVVVEHLGQGKFVPQLVVFPKSLT